MIDLSGLRKLTEELNSDEIISSDLSLRFNPGLEEDPANGRINLSSLRRLTTELHIEAGHSMEGLDGIEE